MGCNQSLPSGAPDDDKNDAARLHNDETEKPLIQDRLDAQNTVKLLVLEANNAGKTTALLQRMKLVHDGGFSEKERLRYRKLILSSIMKSMRSLLEILDELDMHLSHRNERYREIVLSSTMELEHGQEKDLTQADLMQALRCIRHDPVVKWLMQRQSNLVDDSIPFYLDCVDRIVRPGYMPTDQDILRVQGRTPALETTLAVGNTTYRLIHLSAQGSRERRDCLENVEAVLFFASFSDYDQVLDEDSSTNHLQEALDVFDSICNSRWFTQTSFILLLTEADVFAEKLRTIPLENYFPGYEGGDDYDAACDYILMRFVTLNKDTKSRTIYADYITQYTNIVKFVLSAVQDIMLNRLLYSQKHDQLRKNGRHNDQGEPENTFQS